VWLCEEQTRAAFAHWASAAELISVEDAFDRLVHEEPTIMWNAMLYFGGGGDLEAALRGPLDVEKYVRQN
jgi:hypothetical protein